MKKLDLYEAHVGIVQAIGENKQVSDYRTLKVEDEIRY